MTLSEEFDWRHTLRDGGIASALFGVIVLGSMRYNAEIWHDDYPRDIQERAGPMSETAKRQRLLIVPPFFAVLIGLPIYSTLRLKRQHGGHLSLVAAFLNTYGVFELANLFDLVVLDYAFLIKGRPRWALLPGTEDMIDSYLDVSLHIKGFFKGSFFGIFPCLLIAWLLTRGGRRD